MIFHSFARRSERGFILIYVAGILLFLSATVMGMAVALRLDTQVLLRQKENLQSEYRLDAGLQYTLAQLAKAAAIGSSASIDLREKGRMGVWKVNGGLYQAEIGGATVTFMLEDAGGALDLNTLTEEEWTRYFTALSLGSPEEAGLWAKRILEAKTLAGQSNGGKGFASIDDVLAVDTIPAAVRYGRGGEGASAGVGAAAVGTGAAPDVAAATTAAGVTSPTTAGATGAMGAASSTGASAVNAPLAGSAGYTGQIPSLRELFSVGTGIRQLEVNRSPLPLFAALTNAKIEQLVKFGQARQAKPLTVAEAVQILGEPARPILYVGKSPMLRLRMETDAGPGRLGMSVLLKSGDGNYVVAEKRITPVALGASILDLPPQQPLPDETAAPPAATPPPAGNAATKP